MSLRVMLWRLLLIRLGIAGRRYRRCLARIAQLERELFPPPRLIPCLDPGRLDVSPGAIWPVTDANYVQIFAPRGLARAAIAHKADMERRILL